MKNFRNRKEASVPSIVPVIIAVIAIVGVGIWYFTSASESPYWETESEFGQWQEGITIGYTDGTTQELKILQSNTALTVEYQDREIDWIEYHITVSLPDAGGYDSVKVDALGAGITTEFFEGSDNIWSVWTSGSKTITVTPPGSGEKLISYTLTSPYIEDHVPGNGVYPIKFKLSGFVQYWGYPGGEGDKNYATLPDARTVTINVSDMGTGGEISITLTGGVTSKGT
jgi:hypothetical protein